MRLHRFYVFVNIAGQREHTIISAELNHQLRHVFRLGIGDRVVLFDGSGFDHTCTIASFVGDYGVIFDVGERTSSRYMPNRKVWLFMTVVKKDNFEFIVEKATELGVTDIVPVIAERTEKKALNEERLKRIAIEASEQSGRGDVPTIGEVVDFEDALKRATDISSANGQAIAFHTEDDSFDPSDIAEKGKSLAIFIGPEGGWSPAEIALFHTYKIAVRCLGPQVLRAETAAVAALSVVMLGK